MEGLLTLTSYHKKREELLEQADKLKRIRGGSGLSRKAFSGYVGMSINVVPNDNHS